MHILKRVENRLKDLETKTSAEIDADNVRNKPESKNWLSRVLKKTQEESNGPTA